MARIDTSKATSAENLKKEVRKQVEVDLKKRARRKKLLKCGSCLFLLVIVIGGLFLAGAVLLAKSGLYDIPMISSWAFQEPEPIHEVVGEENLDADDLLYSMQSEINDLIESQSPGQLQVSEASITLDEAAITAYLKEVVEPSLNESGFQVRDFQLAVEPEVIEIYTEMTRQEMLFYISILAKPKIVNDNLGLEIERARLGNLAIPTSIIRLFFGPLIESVLKAFKIPTVGFVSLQDIELMYGKVKLIGAIEYTTFR
jgi:hypothetical protein